MDSPSWRATLQQIWFQSEKGLQKYKSVKMMFCFFLSIYPQCGTLASWSIRLIIVCLDLYVYVINLNAFLIIFSIWLYQDTRWCVVRPKNPARTPWVRILTGRKKTSFSHFCISVIPYPIETTFATELPASQGSLHTKV